MPKQQLNRTLFAALAVFCGFALTIVQVFQHVFIPSTTSAVAPTVFNIGTQMMEVDKSGYALPFEIISILLLAALIGCIVIAIKNKPELK